VPTRIVPPGELERELANRLSVAGAPARPKRRRRRSGGRARVRLAGALGTLAILMLGVSGVFATHTLDLFELDGDAVDGTRPAGSTISLAGDDWSNVFAGTDSADATSFTTDVWNDGSDNIFTGGSTKDDLNISGWQCKSGGAVDKNDIEHAFAAAYTKNIDGEDHLILYFGADKFSTSGDAQIGFWFLKGDASCTPTTTGSTTAGFSGSHTLGDILLLSDFTNGGNVSQIRAFQWVGSGGDTNGTLDFVASAKDCDETAADDPLCANVNPVGNEPTGGWVYHQKSNLIGPAPKGADGNYPKGAFYEGGIDLTHFFQGDVECFSTFLAETRQSQSVDSTLEDFALGHLDTCQPDLSLEKTPDSGTYFVGQSFDWTIVVTNSGDGDATDAVVTDTIADGLDINSATTPDGTCDVSGQDVTCTVDVAKDGGTATITVNVTVNGSAVDEGECADVDNEATVTGDEDTSDNTDTGQVTACALTVEKTADTSYDRTFDWTIDKSVNPETADLFDGQTADFDYNIDVTKSAPSDSNFAVSGDITITNPADIAADISDITDTISGGFGEVTVDCGGATSVPANDSLVCTYGADLPNKNDRTNDVAVTAYGVEYDASADITWGDPDNVTNNSDSVDDTINDGDFGPFSTSTSHQYTETYDCSGVEYDEDGVGTKTIDNTATLVNDGDSDDASVTITCYRLSVDKTADTSFGRNFDWMIDKSADQTDLLLAEGQSFNVNYTVTVTPSDPTDANFAVSGDITITNPAPMAADITSIVDTISGGVGVVSVDCGGETSVPANSDLVCTYSSALPDGSDLENDVAVTAYGVEYDASADITFGDPTDTTGDCVDVTDDVFGDLGSVCVGDPAEDFTFEYSVDVGQDLCGEYDLPNVASFLANDGDTGSDDWSVHVSIPCAQGCTLTQGYWKTHSVYGPAPEDDNWNNLPDVDGDTFFEGPDETFFLSGQTWYQVFWTAPKGNAYYILAHQYEAAVLNILNGASAPAEVTQAIADAEAFFETYTPAAIGTLKGKQFPRPEFIALAGTLGSYNEGLIGPGHCDEDSLSSATG
jgi:uncharacterized repeat protein (TIGR01451 family)